MTIIEGRWLQAGKVLEHTPLPHHCEAEKAETGKGFGNLKGHPSDAPPPIRGTLSTPSKTVSPTRNQAFKCVSL